MQQFNSKSALDHKIRSKCQSMVQGIELIPVGDNEALYSCEDMIMSCQSIVEDDENGVPVAVESVPPPPPPEDESFFTSSTPKMNNFRKSTKLINKLMMMLDDDCWSYSSPSNQLSPPLSSDCGLELDHCCSERPEERSKSIVARSRRRPTPTSSPLDGPRWGNEEVSIQSTTDGPEDFSQPPALPVRRDGMCPSNMPSSVLVHMVIGR